MQDSRESHPLRPLGWHWLLMVACAQVACVPAPAPVPAHEPPPMHPVERYPLRVLYSSRASPSIIPFRTPGREWVNGGITGSTATALVCSPAALGELTEQHPEAAEFLREANIDWSQEVLLLVSNLTPAVIVAFPRPMADIPHRIGSIGDTLLLRSQREYENLRIGFAVAKEVGTLSHWTWWYEQTPFPDEAPPQPTRIVRYGCPPLP